MPHSEEAERAVLASLLLQPSLLNTHALNTQLFYSEKHEKIFVGIATLKEEGFEIDILTLQEELKNQGVLEEVGGVAYLASLDLDLPDLGGFDSYLQVLEERKLRRQLLEAAGTLVRNALDGGRVAPETLATHQAALARIATEQGALQDPEYLGDAAISCAEEYAALQPGQTSGIPTGLTDLDRVAGGMERGQLIIWAGRPGMGKSTLMQNIAEYQHQLGHQSKIFSLEMTLHELATRSISRRTGINSKEMKEGRLNEEQRAQLLSAALRVALEANIPVSDLAGVKLGSVLAAARAEAAQGNLRVLWVDHLGLLRPDRRYENRNTALDEMTQELANLAKELGITVNLLHQLNRGVEYRADKRPLLSDLRDSGGIEQNAHRVIFIYRDEVYNVDSNSRGIAELIIAKNRGGPTGLVEVCFQAERVEFSDLSREFRDYDE